MRASASWSRCLSAVAIAAAVGVWSAAGAAQTAEERSDARAFADQGLKAYRAGHHERAIGLFEHAERLVHSPVHLLFLAQSREALGRLVQARETYAAMRRQALPADAPTAFRRAQQTATERMAALAVRIPHVTFVVTGAERDEVVVSVDGKELPSGMEGVRRSIDPGMHRVQARTHGKRSKLLELFVVEGEDRTLTLRLSRDTDALDDDDDERATSTAATAPRPVAPPTDEASSSAATLGWVALAGGAIATSAGVALLLDARSKRGQAETLCKKDVPDGVSGCNLLLKDQIDRRDSQADSSRDLGIAALVLGGAAFTVGAVVLLGSSASDATAQRRTLRAFVGLGSVSVGGEL